jgi:hypothetical protein
VITKQAALYNESVSIAVGYNCRQGEPEFSILAIGYDQEPMFGAKPSCNSSKRANTQNASVTAYFFRILELF